ncbi:MAG: FAD-dependent oxidoreductase [Solirubrobacteraceae bacterium]|nr:FAD-dependent oxidoreductase [Solirubrobacteraceae bacterium]
MTSHQSDLSGASRRVVVIGGVAGGMSAAARLRRLDEHAEITVLERSEHVSYANCGLPYFVGGVIDDEADLLLQTPDSLRARFALDVRVRTEVTSIDRERKVVAARSLDDGNTFEVAYDELLLAPGARPITPPIPGIERALSLRTVEDAAAMRLAAAEASTAVVIGGGFIGVEMAENLVHLGLSVTVIEATSQVMAPLDPEMAEPVHEALRAAGVDLALGTAVTEIGERSVTLADGTTRPADVVVAAIGVRPESALASAAGLEVSDRGGIVVDAQLRTSDPSVFAIGDAVVKRDALTSEAVMVPLAGPANRQGRIVADVIAGRDARDLPVLGTAIVGVFGLQVAVSGWNEKRLRAAGRTYRAIHTHPASHAGYYPGAESMALKLLVDPLTDAILGVQGVGGSGVDKRIDVVATAMRAGIPASGLADLELAYAPQFGSAKDPVNMLGMLAENLADGDVATIQWHELADLPGDVTVVDVRSRGEQAEGTIPGAIGIPVDELRTRLDEVPAGPVVVHCAVGLRGYVAARILTQRGHTDVRNLDGGYRTWQAGIASARPDPVATT